MLPYVKISFGGTMSSFPFSLDPFQISSISKIELNENVLVTAPTSCGKTVCAVSAIIHHLKNNPLKKIIYTSPIKSLSNQKYYEFKKRFKNNVGLLTGDIKYGLHSKILIMTTEILRNLLLNSTKTNNNKLQININVEKDISCVIMDEMHYINDINRGHIWQEILIMLNDKINLVLLSATLNNAKIINNWLNTIKSIPCHLITTTKRIVPLKTYLYFHHTNLNKDRMNKETLNYLQNYCNHFFENNYECIDKIQKLIHTNCKKKKKKKKNNHIKSLSILCKQKKMTPCLYFIFSRKLCEEYAKNLNYSFNTKKKQIEIEKFVTIHLHKLKNKKVYLMDPKRYKMIELWCKGIAYHHSGLQTIYKELIELLCINGYIQILFATETFSVGINAPFKTVIFTKLEKFVDGYIKPLNYNQYLQMCGRAGRRGIDKIGYVILLANQMKLDNIRHVLINKCKNNNNNNTFELTYQLILKILTHNNFKIDDILNKILLKSTIEENKQKMQNIYKFLVKYNYISNTNIITQRGKIAANINEVNEILLTEIITQNIFNSLNSYEICTILGIFATNESNFEQEYYINYLKIPIKLQNILKQIISIKNSLQKIDILNYNWTININFIEAMYIWSKNENIQTFEEISKYYNNYIGNFIREMLRLDNLLFTLQHIYENIYFSSDMSKKIENCHSLIVKGIVANESLYIVKK